MRNRPILPFLLCAFALFHSFTRMYGRNAVSGLLLLFLASASLNAQVLSGHVMDQQKQPLSGASLSLLKADSSVITFAITDPHGYYKLTYTTPDAVMIKVAYIGFQTQFKRITSASSLDFILTETSQTQLREVKVVAKKPLVEYKADRTVFNVENSIGATGGDALDAIKKTPGVQVNHNEISIAGKNSVAITINGRLQQLSGDDLQQLLHSIPSDQVSRIEVITSPSSRYDAEGNSGIINIVLKRNRQGGFRGNASATHEYNTGLHLPTGSLSLYYKKDKLNLSGTTNGGLQGYPYTGYTNTYYPNHYWHQDSKAPYVTTFGRMQLSGDYALTEKSTLGVMVSEASSTLRVNESTQAFSYGMDQVLDSFLTTTGKTRDRFAGKFTANVNYEYRFDSTGKKMNIDLDYYRQSGDKLRDFTIEQTVPGLYTTQSINRVIGLPVTEIKSIKADVEMPLRTIRLTFGVRASDSHNDLNNRYETKTGNEYVNDSSRSNRYLYQEGIQAAYLQAMKTIRKFEFSAGLRAEHTHAEGVSVTTGQTRRYDYLNLFPSALVQYTHNQNHRFTLSISRRINRPNYSFLDPFRFYFTPNTLSQGNPGLQPAFNYLTELGYIYKSNLNMRFMYNHVINFFDSRVYWIDTTTQTSTLTRSNIGDKKYYGLSVSGSLQPAKWWEIEGTITGGLSQFFPFSKSAKPEYSGLLWWFEATNSFYLNPKKTLSAELSGYYYSPRQRDVLLWGEMSAVSFGVRYALFNKNLVVALYGDDVFAKSFWLQTNKMNNSVSYSFDGHTYRFSVSYRFGNSNIRARQIRNSEEVQRAVTQ